MKCPEGQCVKHPYAHYPKDGELGDPMCEKCGYKMSMDRYLVSWQFMGQRSKSFACVVEATLFAKTIIYSLKPIHVTIEPIPF